jgi:hypothetical protein
VRFNSTILLAVILKMYGKYKKPILSCMERGPGPAKYNLPGSCYYKSHDPTMKMNPAYSFGSRISKSADDASNPGPVYLIPPEITRTGKNGAPHYSLHSRLKPIVSHGSPSPNAYYPENVPPIKTPRPPMFSFGARTKYIKRDSVPSPTTYNLPVAMGPKVIDKKSASAFSMTGRSSVGSFYQDFQKTPGPGTYKIVDSGVTKTKLPLYTLKGRNFPPLHQSQAPGPGTYRPEKVLIDKKIYPSFSFGVKHSPYLTSFVELGIN